MPPTPPPKSTPEKQKSAIKAVARYSGLAFQLLAACLLGVFLGRYLDARFQMERPLFAVFLTVLFMIAALVSVARSLMREP
jgi:F0F1-type ATP synthase assembly protein I